MKKRLVLLSIVFIQLLIISIIIKNINKKAASATSISSLQKDTFFILKSGTLQHFYEPKPNSVIKPEVIFKGLENISYHINNDGLNQLTNYSKVKSDGTFRIVTIGDSFTFGSHVNTQDNYPSQLNALLNKKFSCTNIKKFEVVNLGVGGYDLNYAVERLKTRGMKYKPDLVIWLLINDDFNRINEISIPKTYKYLEEAKKNGDYQKQVAKGVYFAEHIKARSEIVKNLGGKKKVLQLQKQYIERLNTFYNGNLLFITFNIIPDLERELIQTIAHERTNTLFYDNLPEIYKIPGASLPDEHPSKKGHTLIAESIIEYLLNQKVLHCSPI